MMRRPVVAGQFYTGQETALKKELQALTSQEKEKIDAFGVVSPHAGYMYSGLVAGEVLSSLNPKSSYIILGPNHTGMGRPFGLDLERTWQTPLGKVEIDGRLGKAILERSRYIKEDQACHNYEHSIEVQLPFLQYLNKAFSIVPIVAALADRKIYKTIGKEIADAIKALKCEKNVTIIASSDMTHYEPHESAKKKDLLAIDKILSLDIDGFLDTIERYDVSMCGFAPTAIMMQASIQLGAKNAKLIRYNTSGDTSGDYSAVVGYAGIVIF